MGLKSRAFLILKYLWENTDEEHTVSLEQIKDYLEDCGLSRPDSRPIKNDIAQIIAFGVDVVVDRRVQNQYFIATRHFDTAELKFLIDAMQSSKFITPKKSKELIAKLAVFVEPRHKQILKRQLYVDYRAKAGNEAILRIVDNIHAAIASKKKIAFQYFEYTPTKQKVHRHDGIWYVVSPYAMLWINDFYYMVGHSDLQGFTATYRTDRIDNLTVADEPATPRPHNFDISDYFGQTFSMFSGEKCQVELLCANELMGSIIDRFGEDVDTEVVDQEHFKVNAAVSLSNNFFGWIFASGGKMRIISPQKAVNQFRDLLVSFS